MPCRCNDPCLAPPAGAVLLASRTVECCIVYRQGATVTKHLRPAVSPAQIKRRAIVAARYPDLFVAINYDAARHIIEQPYIEGRPSTTAEVKTVFDILAMRGELGIYDVGPWNMLVGADGPRIIDFEVGGPQIPLKPGINRVGRRLIILGGLTKDQMRTLHWKV